MTLKEIRVKNGLTQKEAAAILQISIRSYKDYENNPLRQNTNKYNYLYERLEKSNIKDEDHGILTLEEIKKIVSMVFENYKINFCYLFGSYAKGKASDKSDIDLIIDSDITGLDFFGLVEELRTALSKRIDLLKINQLDNNPDLLREVLKDGIKIYG